MGERRGWSTGGFRPGKGRDGCHLPACASVLVFTAPPGHATGQAVGLKAHYPTLLCSLEEEESWSRFLVPTGSNHFAPCTHTHPCFR
jgi:hypothetical protein